MMRIAQHDLESLDLGQGVKHRSPINTGRLHRDMRNLFGAKPFRHFP